MSINQKDKISFFDVAKLRKFNFTFWNKTRRKKISLGLNLEKIKEYFLFWFIFKVTCGSL